MNDNIRQYLKRPSEGGAYGDAQFAALYAHCESGRLAYNSCCCFKAAYTADHALRGRIDDFDASFTHYYKVDHPLADDAEHEFYYLGRTDAERRERLMPMLEEEKARRDGMGKEVECLAILITSAISITKM